MPRHIREIYKFLLKKGISVSEFLNQSAIYRLVSYSDTGFDYEFDGFNAPEAELLHKYRIK